MTKSINLSAGVIFIIFFSSVTVIIIPVSTTTINWVSDFHPHGGYVDEILFVQYPSEDYNQVMYALQRGEIDVYDTQVPVKYLPGLLTDPNISVQIESDNMFRHITLNCENFPTNITGYRRALAYSLDKYKIVTKVTGETGKPLDSYIPPCATEWEIESSMSEHYYEKDITKGNASLEASGFKDLDNDGWREYDVNNNDVWDETVDIDDEECSIEIVFSKGYEPAMISCQVAVEGLLEMGMRAKVVEWDPATSCGGFPDIENAICFSITFGFVNPPIFMYYYFRSGQVYHDELTNLNNDSIDEAIDAIMNATTLEEAKTKCIKAMEMLIFEQPMIVCYNHLNINAYRSNQFEGFFRFSGKGFTGANPYTGTKVHLKESLGGPIGGTLRIAMSKGLESTNILEVTEDTTNMVMNYIYEGLWQVDPHTWDPIPGLAYNWTTEQTAAGGGLQAGQKFTFKLYENATWHDGKNVTSADIKFSMEEPYRVSPYYGPYIKNVYKIETPDTHTVEIYTNKSGVFEFGYATGNFYVLPKHIWEIHGPNYDNWVPSTAAEMVGSGPFKWSTYIPSKNISLLRHDNWHWREEELPTQPSTSSIDTIAIFIGFGTVMVILYFRKRK